MLCSPEQECSAAFSSPPSRPLLQSVSDLSVLNKMARMTLGPLTDIQPKFIVKGAVSADCIIR